MPPGSRDVFGERFHSSLSRKQTQRISHRTPSTSRCSPWRTAWLDPQRWKQPQRRMSPWAERSTPRRPGGKSGLLGSRYRWYFEQRILERTKTSSTHSTPPRRLCPVVVFVHHLARYVKKLESNEIWWNVWQEKINHQEFWKTTNHFTNFQQKASKM